MRRHLAQLIMWLAPGLAEDIGRRQAVLARRREAQRQASLRRHLADAAATDPLTGLGNRRAFDDHFREVVARDAARGAALILIDLDHFKQINDTCGHVAGDAALQAVGRVLSSQTRARSDRAFRIGGEEFAVVTTHCRTREQLQGMAVRLIGAIARERVQRGPVIRPLTASAGAAFIEVTAPDFAATVTQADAMLYAAKRDGRNRACA